MNPASGRTGTKWDLHKIQQAVKWMVYTLLIINFVFYIFEDWNRAVHTLDSGSTFLDWTGEFATSIDESAWFILLFMFELETYVIADKDWTTKVARVVHSTRSLSVLRHAGAHRIRLCCCSYRPSSDNSRRKRFQPVRHDGR